MADSPGVTRTDGHQWQRLAQRTHRYALLEGSPSVEQSGYQGRLRMSPGRKVVGPAFGALGAGLLILAARLLSDPSDVLGGLLACIVGMGFLLVGTAVTIYVAEVFWNNADRTITVRYGWWPCARMVRAKAQNIRPHLRTSDDSTGQKTAGCSQLWISQVGEKDEVLLVEHNQHKAVAKAFETLERVCGKEGIDETFIALGGAGQDGADIHTRTTALGIPSASHRDWQMQSVKTDEVVFVASQVGKAFWVLFAICGAIGLTMAPGAYRVTPLLALLPLCMGGLFVAAGVAGVLGTLDIRPRLTADRTRRTIVLRGNIWERTRTVPFASVAAVQVCWRYENGSEDTRGYTTYEMNLVLREPAGERIGILSHAKEDAVRADAAALAEFLGVPLLDHAKRQANG